MLLELLKPVLNLELSIKEANIKLQLRKRLTLNIAALGCGIDKFVRRTQATGSPSSKMGYMY